MGGSGGGAAGEVSWPSYLENAHSGLIGSFSTSVDTGTALAYAVSGNPYTADAFDPDGLIAQLDDAVSNFGNSLAVTNPWDEWNNIMNTSINRYDIILGDRPVIRRPEPSSWQWIEDLWASINSSLTAPDDIDTYWTDPISEAATDIVADWTDPSPDSPSDISTELAASSTITAAVSAYGARLSDAITSDTLPRFQAGMRDINAVQSSAFSIGAAIIEAMRVRDVANFDADLTTKLTAQQDQLLGQAFMQDDKINAANLSDKNKMIGQSYLDNDKMIAGSLSDKNKLISQAYLESDKLRSANDMERNKMRSQGLLQGDKLFADSDKAESLINAEMARHGTGMVYQDADLFWKTLHQQQSLYGTWAAAVVDSNRIKYVMQKEENDKNIEYDATYASWRLDMAQKAANVLASVSGGTSYTPGPTPAQNALGGAFSGAAIGARVSGNAYGAGAGAILGGIGAYLLGGR